jgi:hypothetical protein
VSKKSKRKAAARQARRAAASLPGASPPPAATARKPAPARRPKPGRRPDRPRTRRLGVLLAGVTALVLVVAGYFAINALTQQSGILAGTDSQANGQAVDGISCNTTEQLVYHIHAHLAVYTNGTARTIPAGIGIVPPVQTTSSSSGPFVYLGTCFYWLHSHTQDGVIHIESPTQQVYTLGNYFDIWGQPLSSTQVGPATGQVTAWVNGQPFSGNPRTIPLIAHALIQLDVGSKTPGPQPFTFAPGL